MPLLFDTGVLYALADRDDTWHGRSVAYLRRSKELRLVPATVVPEVTYLMQTRLGGDVERRFVQSIVDRELVVEPLTDADWNRAAELMGIYDVIGFVDASVIAIGERLRLSTIATTDHRHFRAVRPAHRASFDLVP